MLRCESSCEVELSTIADAEFFRGFWPTKTAGRYSSTDGGWMPMFGDQSRRGVLRWAGLGGVAALARGLLPRSTEAQDVSTLTVGWGTDIDSLDPAQFKPDGANTSQ